MNEIIKITEDFIRCESFNKDNCNRAIELAKEILREGGVQSEIIENKGYKMLVSQIGKGEKTIILNGHLDVVPGYNEQYNPFIDGDKLFGRGSYDMLGASAVMIRVFKDLALLHLNVKVLLMLVSTEEFDGSICTQYLINKGYVGNFAICGEPTNLKISIMSKGVLQVRLKIYGSSAHSSKPWLGDNALTKAYETYKKICELSFTKEKNEYFPSPSINLSKVSGGNVINQVPDYAEMEMDIRYLPEQKAEDIIEEIKKLDKSMEIEILSTGSPVYTPTDNYYVSTLINEVSNNSKDKKIIIAQHGTADTRFFQYMGIPSVEFGPTGANHHGKDEYVEIQSLEQYKKILFNFLMKFDIKN